MCRRFTLVSKSHKENPALGERKDRVTAIVAAVKEGPVSERAGAEELFTIVYDELRRLARRYMSRETPGHTLQPTALVHEAYLKLVDQARVDWQGRTHFFAVGAKVMRNLLIDHARGRASAKRGGGLRRITLADVLTRSGGKEIDIGQIQDLDAALDKLEDLDERQARIVELRFFGGLNMDEIAHALGVSKRTIEGDWTHARAWLKRELASATKDSS
jgi:RNA polymerase sigma factor (TIGR02999 family)